MSEDAKPSDGGPASRPNAPRLPYASTIPTGAWERPRPPAPPPAPGPAAPAPPPVEEVAEATAVAAPPPAPRRSVEERIAQATNNALRTRRDRIDRRLEEIAFPIGDEALSTGLPIHSTRQIDIDRVLKKIDRVENDIADAERGPVEKPAGLFQALSADLARLSERFAARELHEKRHRLVTELGLALLASDLRALRKTSPEVATYVERHAEDARAVDELFRQARLVDDELAARAADGRLHREPKAIERFVARTGEVVGDAGDVAKEKLVDLGKTAAKAAVKTSGKAVWGLAKGAFKIGKQAVTGDEDESDDDDDDLPRSRRSTPERKKLTSREASELLRELAKLHDDGVLDDDEYAAKKAEILKRI